MQSNNPELITVREAAELAGVTVACIHHWHWRGKLHAIKVGSKVMTTPAEVHRAADLMSQDARGRKRLGERQALEQAAAEEQEHAAV